MKYTVRFSCGHVEAKVLFGKGADRDRTIQHWQDHGVCTDCYRQAQVSQEQKSSSEMGLPTLTGSEKQVTWATKLRLEMISERQQDILALGIRASNEKGIRARLAEIGKDALLTEVAAKFEGDKRDHAVDFYCKAIVAIKKLDEAKTQPSAKWFIENRQER